LHYAILVTICKAAAVSKALKKGISKKGPTIHTKVHFTSPRLLRPQAYVPKKEGAQEEHFLDGHSIIKYPSDHGVLDEVD
jgi:hypothetical protein